MIILCRAIVCNVIFRTYLFIQSVVVVLCEMCILNPGGAGKLCVNETIRYELAVRMIRVILIQST